MEDYGLADTTSQFSAGHGYAKVVNLPANFDVKPKMCKCCGEISHNQSPLEDGAEDDTYGGKRPWLRYLRVQGTDDPA